MPFVLKGNLESDTMCRFGMAEIQQGGGAKASWKSVPSPRQRRPAVWRCLYFPVTNHPHLLIECQTDRAKQGKPAFPPEALRDRQHAVPYPACGHRTHLKGDSRESIDRTLNLCPPDADFCRRPRDCPVARSACSEFVPDRENDRPA